MRTEPPAGDDFERMIVRITENVLLTAGSQLPAAASVPKPRFRFGALSIVVLVLLGLGAAGGAVAIGLVSSPWPAVNPTATTSSDATPTRTPQPTATAAAPVVPALPTVAIADASFSPPSWGQGMAVDLSGFAPNTDFSVSVDSHYSAGSTTPDEYFSVLTTPITVTTDGRGRCHSCGPRIRSRRISRVPRAATSGRVAFASMLSEVRNEILPVPPTSIRSQRAARFPSTTSPSTRSRCRCRPASNPKCSRHNRRAFPSP